jgi:hypothetical protein
MPTAAHRCGLVVRGSPRTREFAPSLQAVRARRPADRARLRRAPQPQGARFPVAEADLVAKAAQLMGLKVYQAGSEDLAALAKKLPVGRLYGNGRGFVPNIRQSLYSEFIVSLAVEPQAAVGKDQDELPVATGLPRTWDEIAPGHLAIAQEALEYGWWEAIVLARDGDMFTLRFRDYPKLPKFARHRAALALMSPPARQPNNG